MTLVVFLELFETLDEGGLRRLGVVDSRRVVAALSSLMTLFQRAISCLNGPKASLVAPVIAFFSKVN